MLKPKPYYVVTCYNERKGLEVSRKYGLYYYTIKNTLKENIKHLANISESIHIINIGIRESDRKDDYIDYERNLYHIEKHISNVCHYLPSNNYEDRLEKIINYSKKHLLILSIADGMDYLNFKNFQDFYNSTKSKMWNRTVIHNWEHIKPSWLKDTLFRIEIHIPNLESLNGKRGVLINKFRKELDVRVIVSGKYILD